MRKITKLMRVCGGAALILTSGACSSWCRNDLRAEKITPNGQMKAVVFDRDCGGAVATAWGPHVVLLDSGAALDEHDAVGDLFAARVPAGVRFGDTLVTIEWRTDTTLVLRYDPRLDVRLAVLRLGDVNVEYGRWR